MVLEVGHHQRDQLELGERLSQTVNGSPIRQGQPGALATDHALINTDGAAELELASFKLLLN